MSNDNAKLRLAPEQSIEEWMQENGYKPVGPAEGTDKAFELMHEARADLDEAYDRMEEDTGDHDTVGTACDELDYVINQMWPDDDGEQWQDGSDPMEHAISCFMHCREIAVYGDQGAPSTGIVCGAAANLNTAAVIIWGEKYQTALEKRRDEADCRRAAATLEAMFEDADEGATDEEETISDAEAVEGLTDAMYARAAEFPISSRAEAVKALADATGDNVALLAMLLKIAALLKMTDPEDEPLHDMLTECSKVASDATMNLMRVAPYLSGNATDPTEEGEE